MEVDITMTQDINYWAVLVGAVAFWILGAIWYSGPLFGKAWMRSIGKTEEQVKADFSPMNLIWAFVYGWLASYGIARVMMWMGGDTIADGVMVGLVASVCFSFATIGMHDVMEKRPGGLTLINALYSIVGFLVMGIIIGAWH